MPFQFPDPNVQTEVVHPITGETWHYHDGAWEVEDSQLDPAIPATHSHPTIHAPYALADEVDQNEEQLQALSVALFSAQSKIETLEGLDISNALSALAIAQQDIIDLKSKVNSLELTSFLIME